MSASAVTPTKVNSTGSTPPGGPSLASLEPPVRSTCCQRFGRSMKQFGSDIIGSLVNVISFLFVRILLGGAARVFYPQVSIPAAIYLGVTFLTALSMKLLDRYHFSLLDSIKEKVIRLRQSCKYISIIALVVCIGLAILSPMMPIIAYPAAALLGIFDGIAFGINAHKKEAMSTAHSLT